MLVSLRVENVLLIESLSLSFGGGLTVLSGETGAGKSLLLDSLALALGARSDVALIRKGKEQATINACFRPQRPQAMQELLSQHAISYDSAEALCVRRVLSLKMPSRAFIQDQPVSLGLLRRLGHLLVDVQGQSEQSRLLDARSHNLLFDCYAHAEEHGAEVVEAWQGWQAAIQERLDAERTAKQNAADAEYARFSAEELAALAPEVGEEQVLSSERAMLMNAESLGLALSKAEQSLGEESSGAEKLLEEVLGDLSRAASRGGGETYIRALSSPLESLERSLTELREARAALRALGESLHSDQAHLESIEERLALLRSVARKHRVECDALARLCESLRERAGQLAEQAEALGKAQAREGEFEAEYSLAAQKLSEKRRAAQSSFQQRVASLLPSLNLGHARFEVALQPIEPSPQGRENVQFQIATLSGYQPDKLQKIASAGELSRVLLAVNVALADVGQAECLIFDEVDSGIGGASAAAVGGALRTLAERKQVLVITHTPQVAAAGEAQFRVEKRSGEGLGREETRVVRLEEGARVEEVARMLSGARVNEEARKAAHTLLEDSRVTA